MASKDEIDRSQQINCCLKAIAITVVIFGILYSIERGGAVTLFAVSISWTGLPFWFMVKRYQQIQSGVAHLWAIHSGVNLCGWLMAIFLVEYAREVGLFLVLILGFGLILFHLGLLARATFIVREKGEMVDKFALSALLLCPLLFAIGIIFFET